MKPKVNNDINAQSILKRERELVFAKSPVTDEAFEKAEEIPEKESEFDPRGNNNEVIYGPPEVMGLADSKDWFKND